MNLTPVTTTTEPRYPTYSRTTSPVWKKIAAVAAVGAALWLPACGGPTRLGGDQQPIEEVRPPGTMPVQQVPQPEVKPPETPQPPVLPEPEPVRLSGSVAPVTPPNPVDPAPVRLAGDVQAPEPPKRPGH